MNKLNTLLKVIKTLIRNPYSLKRVIDPSISDSLNKWETIASNYGFPNGLPVIDILDLLPEFNIEVFPYSFLEGTSSLLDLALLNALARKYDKCSYLEIGTWRGESVANVAKSANRCISISLSEEEMLSLGLSEEFIKAHRFFSKDIPNIQHIEHNSLTFDYTTLQDKFDLVFIDGDHAYENVKVDTQNIFPVLKDDTSIIVWHDYGFSPERIRWEVLSGILDGCPYDKRGNLYHISNTLCAIYIPSGVFNTTYTKFPAIPNKRFRVQVTSEKIE